MLAIPRSDSYLREKTTRMLKVNVPIVELITRIFECTKIHHDEDVSLENGGREIYQLAGSNVFLCSAQGTVQIFAHKLNYHFMLDLLKTKNIFHKNNVSDPDTTIVMPITINNEHWTLCVFTVNGENKVTKIQFYDSHFTDERLKVRMLKQALYKVEEKVPEENKFLNATTQIEVCPSPTQYGTFTDGDWTVYNTIKCLSELKLKVRDQELMSAFLLLGKYDKFLKRYNEIALVNFVRKLADEPNEFLEKYMLIQQINPFADETDDKEPEFDYNDPDSAHCPKFCPKLIFS